MTPPTVSMVLRVLMSQYYQLHGLRIRAVGDPPAVARVLDRILRYKGAEEAPASESVDVTLNFTADREAPPVPKEARHVDLGEHFGIGVLKTSDRMILRHDETMIDLRPGAGVAEGAISADCLAGQNDRRGRSLLSYLAALSLAILLRGHGWFPLHAAALTRGEHGVLISARSGGGKSTAALSLVRNGWGYLSDDTVLLRSEGERIVAYSFRRHFCVNPDLASHFPELRESEWPPALSDPAKWKVDVEQVYPGQFMATCTPRLIVLPDLVDAPKSRVEPVDPKPVLERLISQGAFFLAPNSDVADRHLAALRALIDQSRTYRLHAGRDVLEEPRTLHALLTPLLEEVPTTGDA